MSRTSFRGTYESPDPPAIMKLVVPRRCSTDQKRQDTARQDIATQRWAAQHGGTIVAAFDDYGSGASNPLERPGFAAAFECALREEADLLVEDIDRVLRLDSDEFAWLKVELRRKGVRIYSAAWGSPAEQEGRVARIRQTIEADEAGEYRTKLSRRVKEGMQSKQAFGGRPVATISPVELDILLRVKDQDGQGFRKARHAILVHRGVYELADDKARKKRLISLGKIVEIYQAHHAGQLVEVGGRLAAPQRRKDVA